MEVQQPLNFSTPTQTEKILSHLKSGRSITPLDALREFGCFRLGGRIFDIRKLGYEVKTKMIDVGNGKRVAEYRLEDEENPSRYVSG